MANKRNKTPGRPRLPLSGVSESIKKIRSDARKRSARNYYNRDPKRYWAKSALANAQERSKAKDLDCDITMQELLDLTNQTDTCPMTGMMLDYSRGKSSRPNSPTVDRIDNTRGYELSNIHIVSRDANMAKGRLNLDELVHLGNWALRQQQADLKSGEDQLAKLMAVFFDAVEKFEQHANTEISRE